VDWNAVSAIGSIAGAIGVMATLVYVSRQIREQNRALQTTIRDSAFQQLQAWNHQIMADRDLAHLFQRGAIHADWSAMDERDRARLVHVFYSFFKVFENIYLHAADGSLPAQVWDRNCAVFFAYAKQPGCRFYWQQRRETFDPRFRAVLDGDLRTDVLPGSQFVGIADLS
jgi:hypothetical protein